MIRLQTLVIFVGTCLWLTACTFSPELGDERHIACSVDGTCPNPACACFEGQICIPPEPGQDPAVCAGPEDDGGVDAGEDGGEDGGLDAGQDAGEDAGDDAGLEDAGEDGGDDDGGYDGGGDDGGDDAGSDADGGSADGSNGPIELTFCANDSVCEPAFESCSTCPVDCRGCDTSASNNTIRYVDPSCELSGDGTEDVCALEAGDSGRYNELQMALNNMTEGMTLVLHGGDYSGRPPSTMPEADAVYLLSSLHAGSSSTMIIRAADVGNPPVLHSCDPETHEACLGVALRLRSVQNLVMEGIHINGQLDVVGSRYLILQNLFCTRGWGHCGQGDWTCVHMDTSQDVLLRNTCISGLSGRGRCEGCGAEQPCDEGTAPMDSGTGIRVENSSAVTIEFNRVDGAPAYGVDVENGEGLALVRFNEVVGAGQVGIRFQGTESLDVYGNLLPSPLGGWAPCVQVLNGAGDTGSFGAARVLNNTCMGYARGLDLQSDNIFNVEGNVIGGLWYAGEPGMNLLRPFGFVPANFNAYDSDGNFKILANPGGADSVFADLAAYQVSSGQDMDSMECEMSCCDFVAWPPDEFGIYDLRMNEGACVLNRDDGTEWELGAYGLEYEPGTTCPD